MNENELLFEVAFDGTEKSAVTFLSVLMNKGVRFTDFDYDYERKILTVELGDLYDELIMYRSEVLYFYKDGTIRINRILCSKREEE